MCVNIVANERLDLTMLALDLCVLNLGPTGLGNKYYLVSRFILKNSMFQFSGTFFRQKKGSTMVNLK